MATPVAAEEDHVNDGGMFWDYGGDDTPTASGTKPANAGKEAAGAKAKGAGKTLSKAETSQFSKWCQSELQKLTGSDDSTLGEFLMSLHSAAEVQEYVMDYLGPQGKAFAEEFVFRKQMDSVEVVSGRGKKPDGPAGAGAGGDSVWDEGVVGSTPVGKKKKKKGKGSFTE